MRNPWLDIPLQDYEGHMSLPSVGRAPMLAHQLEQLVERYAPSSVAIIGCAGGNGMDRVEPGQLQRLMALDINPAYIEAARARHVNRLPGLQLCRAGGVLAALVQLPHAGVAAISPSPYQSLKMLAPIMKLVAPAELDRLAASAGFALEASESIALASGKQFSLRTYRRFV